MDRIAVISDIHGNIPALEAVLADIWSRGITRIFCLGDLAGKGPAPVKAVDLIRETCELVIQGNWDYMLCNREHDVLTWHQEQLGAERLSYLGSLPLYHEFYMSGRLIRLCHASPNDIFFRTYISTPEEERLKLFAPTPTLNRESDIVGYGDIHGAYVDCFENKILFNTGSVGNPLDIPQSAYAVIEGNLNSEIFSSISASVIRVPYDIERAVQEALCSDMPEQEAYIKELRTAIYRGRSMRHA
jgi:predicted phosphodiesterase